jgi:hypothetical protein
MHDVVGCVSWPYVGYCRVQLVLIHFMQTKSNQVQYVVFAARFDEISWNGRVVSSNLPVVIGGSPSDAVECWMICR